MTTQSIRTALSCTLLAFGGYLAAMPSLAVAQTGVAAQTCQQFTQTITVAGKSQLGYGLQCLQPDGTWHVVTPAGLTPVAPPQVASVAPYPPYVPYSAPYDYGYVDPYYYGAPLDYGYPWYFGPDIGIGIGIGRGWHGGGGGGGFHGGGGGGGFHGGGGGGHGR